MARRRVFVVAGCGGAGKETVARLLYDALEPCAWVDMKTVIRVRPWEYGEALICLGVENAAGLARRYLAAGFSPVIVSGGLGSQESLDLFLDLVGGEAAVDYVWLHADKPVRDARRLGRARDDADRREYLDAVDGVVPDPGVLRVRGGCYHRIDTTRLAPEGVLAEVLRALQLESR